MGQEKIQNVHGGEETFENNVPDTNELEHGKIERKRNRGRSEL